MHSFAGDEDTALACVELGLYISFAGMVTFKKNDALRAVAAKIPLDRLLIETDAPYLAPVPFRGKRNEPAYVRHTAECLATVRGMTPDEIGELTTSNARQLFPFPEPEALSKKGVDFATNLRIIPKDSPGHP
jgi:TatD DNase family protein